MKKEFTLNVFQINNRHGSEFVADKIKIIIIIKSKLGRIFLKIN